ncbi:LLM class flavin-dependent oxidoreductase [Candidatus Thorarchaeota archaeon]|nr:MAG: LLM class flavin-dependent oxidoreductase [Candidatus Thorarchaeota archaeon]
MKKNIEFGARLSRIISTVAPDSENINITPYEQIRWPLVRDAARECERLGFDSVIVPDHPMDDVSRYACMSTLAALAACTERITVGTLTTNTMRYLPNPSLFIKEIATLDHISNGRLYPFGLGLGWTPHEYEAFGFPFPKHKIRLAQMVETIEMMNLMFTEETADYEGEHFQIKGAVCEPKPVQKPFPIVIGGRGNRTLGAAAKYAHHIDIYGGMDLEDLADRLAHIENVCSEIGRDFNEIVFSWGCWFWIYEDDKERDRYAAEIKRLKEYPEDRWSANIIMGTPEEMIEKFESLIDLGMTYFTLRFEDLPSTRGIRLFAERVIPELT